MGKGSAIEGGERDQRGARQESAIPIRDTVEHDVLAAAERLQRVRSQRVRGQPHA